eukprot:gb/GFBE01027432.1/.p1 GENE.gb/GFBE01027432.1/~~gb/GFBE01027432.1/.p1  ORF type:complete len:286 (+),score=43.40 gb/GFBE01027432.1/:1-858(+)
MMAAPGHMRERAVSSSALAAASSNAFKGGIAAMSVQMACVPAFMWMNTVTNYQYRHGGRVGAVIRQLWAEGGVARFYRGLLPALLHSPTLRFGSLAANEGLLAAAGTTGLSPCASAVLASGTAAGFRVLLMPMDAWRTAKQVHGASGLHRLIAQARAQPGTLWRGAAGSVASTWVSYCVWCLTNNWLRTALPRCDSQDLLRNGGIGFCSNVVADTCSNSLRVLKTLHQTSPDAASYGALARRLVAREGFAGLLGRGLSTKVVSSGLQGAMFFIGYQAILDRLGSS